MTLESYARDAVEKNVTPAFADSFPPRGDWNVSLFRVFTRLPVGETLLFRVIYLVATLDDTTWFGPFICPSKLLVTSPFGLV